MGRHLTLMFRCDGCGKEVQHQVDVSEKRDREGYRTGKMLIDNDLPEGWFEQAWGCGVFCPEHRMP